MAAKVSYKQGTKATYLSLPEHLATALYFCTDTRELFKGDDLYTDGLRLVSNHAALPEFAVAADGILYFCEDNGCGYVLNTARNGWITVIHGVDNATLEIGDDGLMQVKAVPVDSVTGLGAYVDSIVQKAVGELDVDVDFATVEKAGIVKPGEGLTVDADGTLRLESVEISQIAGLEERLADLAAAQVGGVHYKGSVATVADLPEDAKQGDLYEVAEDNSEWCWNGEKWFEYGKTTNLSPIATATLDETQFEIDADKILHLIGVDSGLVTHRGEDLRAVLDALTKSVMWEDMGVDVDPSTDDIAKVLDDASEGDVLDIAEGAVAVQMTVTKSATIRGEAAGIPQNFAQEV